MYSESGRGRYRCHVQLTDNMSSCTHLPASLTVAWMGQACRTVRNGSEREREREKEGERE
jgi:hypothetical protein